MKTPVYATLLLIGLCHTASGDVPASVQARTVYHGNGTRTESTQDPTLHEQREFTYDQHNVLISKKIYLLNEKGQTIQGNVYDGRDVLKARASFLFDDFGRMIEQRMSNLQGEVYQSILFTYDAKGNPLPPKSRTYSTNSPDMKSSVIDFTRQGDAPAPMDRRSGDPAPKGNVPRLPESSGKPAAPKTTEPAGDQPKKRSLWNRLLNKDDKK